MDSFIQVAELVLMPLVSNPVERECWRLHVDIVYLLQQRCFSQADLATLETKINKWRTMMVDLYGEVEDRRRTGGSRKKGKKAKKKKKAKKRKKRTKDNRADREEDTDDADDTDDSDENDADDKKCLSFKFPNFEVAGHWPRLIRFLGPPWFQDTRLWEHRHLAAKTTARRTNQHNTELAILTKTHEKDAISRHASYAGKSDVITPARRTPYSLTTKSEKITDIGQGRKHTLRLAVHRELGPAVSIDFNGITSRSGAHFYGHLLRPGNGILLRVPAAHTGIEYSFEDRVEPFVLPADETWRHVVVARISRFLHIPCGDGKARRWLELELLEESGVHEGFRQFKLSQRRHYVPLGWNGWTIASRIFLVPRGNLPFYFLNHRIRWQLRDRWASVLRPYVTPSLQGDTEPKGATANLEHYDDDDEYDGEEED